MYLIDTNVISELRKQAKANPGVVSFFHRVTDAAEPVFLSAITIGELCRGIERIRYRGDPEEAAVLDAWLRSCSKSFTETFFPSIAKPRRFGDACESLIPITNLTSRLLRLPWSGT